MESGTGIDCHPLKMSSKNPLSLLKDRRHKFTFLRIELVSTKSLYTDRYLLHLILSNGHFFLFLYFFTYFLFFKEKTVNKAQKNLR